jgi:MFS family permease
MSNTTQQPTRTVPLLPRRARELLGAALELYGRHPLTLIALVATMLAPLEVLNWQAGCHPYQGCRITVLDGVVVSTAWWTTIVWAILPILLVALVGALLAVTTRTITAQLVGQHRGVQHALRFGLTRPGWLLQVAILVVGPLATLVLLNFARIYLSGLASPPSQLAMVVVVIAVLYAGVGLAVSVPVAVVEDRRWPQALTRSWSLVDGHWGHVAATLFQALLATALVGGFLTAFTAELTGLLVGDDWLIRTLLQAAALSLVLPYLLVVWVLLYLDLRNRKEHLNLNTLTADLQGPKT